MKTEPGHPDKFRLVMVVDLKCKLAFELLALNIGEPKNKTFELLCRSMPEYKIAEEMMTGDMDKDSIRNKLIAIRAEFDKEPANHRIPAPGKMVEA